MKSTHLILCSLFAAILMVCVCQAGKKEVKGSVVNRVDKPNGKGEFQLRVRYKLPDIPDNAHIDYALLIIDQKFEMPAVADTSRRRTARDTSEVPKGLANKQHSPLFLSVYALDEKKANASGPWLDGRSSKDAEVFTATLPPVEIVQQERKLGRWGNEAVKAFVTQFIRAQPKKGSPSVEFVIAAAGGDPDALHPSRVDVDVSNLSGRLVIYYTEPPVLPRGTGTDSSEKILIDK